MSWGTPLTMEIICIAREFACACARKRKRKGEESERERRGTRLLSRFSSRQNFFSLRERETFAEEERRQRKRRRGERKREKEMRKRREGELFSSFLCNRGGERERIRHGCSVLFF